MANRITGWLQSQARKVAYIQAAKNRPCADCEAEGRDPNWPVEAMSLDHIGEKRMWLSDGGDKRDGSRTGGLLNYLSYPFAEVKAEVDGCEAVCMNHHNIRTRQQNRDKARPRIVAADVIAPPTLFDALGG